MSSRGVSSLSELDQAANISGGDEFGNWRNHESRHATTFGPAVYQIRLRCMIRRPTIIDVAARAGVSKSTVSLVLQNSTLVKADTCDLVHAAMTELGYVYNRSAANLRSAKVGLIGLVINDLRNPFFTEFATSAQTAFSRAGFATVIANTDEDPEIQAQVVVSMIEHGVSAVVISPTYGQEAATFDPLIRARIPVLQVLRRADPTAFPFASFDYVTGGRLATQHLVDLGAQRIAFCGGLQGRAITLERMSGYLEVIEKSGLRPLILNGRSTGTFGRETAGILLHQHPDCDAALCFNDLVAMGLMAGFSAVNKQVGQEFKLVGFDNIEDCTLVHPQLSSVNCNITMFADDTAKTMLGWLQDGMRPADETRMPVELMARMSSLGVS